jgi:WD40 repeat protein
MKPSFNEYINLLKSRITLRLLIYFKIVLVVIGDWISGQVIEYFDNGSFTQIFPNFHTDTIRHLKYLPYKNYYVASASVDKTVNVWNTLTWASIQRYKNHTNWVFSLDQIDNDTLVSGSHDGTIRIWKISTGETLQTISVGAEVNVVRVLSIELKQIVCGKQGSTNNLQIYSYDTGNWVRTLIGHSSSVRSIEMLSEQFMATGSDDKRVLIWDISSFSIKFNLTGHNSAVNCIKRLSSNLIASGDSDGLIIVWNWLTGIRIFNLIGHMGPLFPNSLDLYDDQTLISGSLDLTVKFWNITNGTLIQSINVDIQISALSMLKSSELLVNKILLLVLQIFN